MYVCIYMYTYTSLSIYLSIYLSIDQSQSINLHMQSINPHMRRRLFSLNRMCSINDTTNAETGVDHFCFTYP